MADDSSSSDVDVMDAIAAAVMAVVDDPRRDDDGPREEVIPLDINGWRNLSNSSFKENFRMDRVVFERFIAEVGMHIARTNRLIRQRTPLDHCLMMGLWALFNPDTFRSSGFHFGKRKAVIHFHYKYLIEVLREMAPRYIKWPSQLERERIKTEYEESYGFPGAVGAIDGVHIAITAPLEQPQNYVNRHHSYSILVQAVCDNRLLYRDVYCGEAGSIGDLRNFQRSPLSMNLLTCPEMFSKGEHIVGDGAYPNSSKLLTPYIDDGHLTPRQRTFNYTLSATRCSVERSFCLLKGKERRLQRLHMRNPIYVNDHIISSFVVHNFIILEGADSEGLPPINPRPIAEAQYQNILNEAVCAGAIKREYIAHIIHVDGE